MPAIQMDQDAVAAEVENVIRTSEIKAVALAMNSGRRPRLGDVIDYFIQTPQSAHRGLFEEQRIGSGRRAKPYRLSVEQWHLDAAEDLNQR